MSNITACSTGIEFVIIIYMCYMEVSTTSPLPSPNKKNMKLKTKTKKQTNKQNKTIRTKQKNNKKNFDNVCWKKLNRHAISQNL